jgi:thymidylate synthase (FAD)
VVTDRSGLNSAAATIAAAVIFAGQKAIVRAVLWPYIPTRFSQTESKDMAHAHNGKADALLDREFRVLDKGFVRLVDYMGSDESIVQAARVSYGEGTKKIQEDRGLIRYLMRHHHTTPFEMVEFKFHVKLPIFVARQWIRHRTANVNEYSGRYSIMKEEFYLPKPEDIQTQSTRNKQGRSDEQLPDDVKARFLDDLTRIQGEAYRIYAEAIDNDIARELARIDLPLSLYTEWYWKIDLHNLFHFLRLRIDDHAQKEFREYAVVMGDMVRTVCPIAYEAFEDYILQAVSFSGPELKILCDSLKSVTTRVEDLTAHGLSKREASEFEEKLRKIRGHVGTD